MVPNTGDGAIAGEFEDLDGVLDDPGTGEPREIEVSLSRTIRLRSAKLLTRWRADWLSAGAALDADSPRLTLKRAVLSSSFSLSLWSSSSLTDVDAPFPPGAARTDAPAYML